MSTSQIIDIGYEPPSKKKILVVDDESALQTLIIDALESDHRLLSAFNGREGVEKAGRFMPDLILMDVMMPDIGGYDAIRLLNSNAATKSIPVIAMSAQDFDDSTIQLIRAEPNVVAFLTKPFRPRELRDVVNRALSDRKS